MRETFVISFKYHLHKNYTRLWMRRHNKNSLARGRCLLNWMADGWGWLGKLIVSSEPIRSFSRLGKFMDEDERWKYAAVFYKGTAACRSKGFLQVPLLFFIFLCFIVNYLAYVLIFLQFIMLLVIFVAFEYSFVKSPSHV